MIKYLGWIVAAAVTTSWVAAVFLAPEPEPIDLSQYEEDVRIATERLTEAENALVDATLQLAVDSARWEQAREDAATHGYNAGVRSVELTERADSAATDLSVVLEPEELELFYEFLAVEDSLHAAQDEVITTQAARIQSYEEERTSLYITIDSHRGYEEVLNGTLDAERILSGQQRSAIEAEQALRRRVELKGNINKAIAVGGASKVCYDASNDGNVGLAVGACAVALLVGIS